jgi:Zn-dependent protease
LESNEIFDIGVSVLALSVAFSIGTIQTSAGEVSKTQFFPIILLTVGVGFVAHELAHRFVAKHYGAVAYFKAWPEGLLLMFVMAFVTGGQVLFAAPGAVYIYSSYLSRRQNGIISISGALMNCLLAVLFLFVGLAIGIGLGESPKALDLATAFITFGTFTNIYLAFFNMIPIPPLDGSKVFAWSPVVWFIFFAILFVLVFGFFAVV